MSYASINCIEFVFAKQKISDSILKQENPEWDLANISRKTGVRNRYIANPNQCASDLAVLAAEKLFSKNKITKSKIDFLLFCTQSGDYVLPATTCLLQERLGLRNDCGSFDYSIGCSGFIYGLGMAKELLETNQADNVLLITADTYSRYINPKDKCVRALFSDAAAATLVTRGSKQESIGPFSYFTNGRGANNLIVRDGGLRYPTNTSSYEEIKDKFGNTRSNRNLFMNGPEIMTFSLSTVPYIVDNLLKRNNLSLDDINYFVFHQANKYILSELRKKLKIPTNKFHLTSCNKGNTVASTIPIALKRMQLSNNLSRGMKLLLVGFGTGYSAGAVVVNWV